MANCWRGKNYMCTYACEYVSVYTCVYMYVICVCMLHVYMCIWCFRIIIRKSSPSLLGRRCSSVLMEEMRAVAIAHCVAGILKEQVRSLFWGLAREGAGAEGHRRRRVTVLHTHHMCKSHVITTKCYRFSENNRRCELNSLVVNWTQAGIKARGRLNWVIFPIRLAVILFHDLWLTREGPSHSGQCDP